MNKKSRRIEKHMHVHYFHGENGICSCGNTLDQLIKQKQNEKKKKI